MTGGPKTAPHAPSRSLLAAFWRVAGNTVADEGGRSLRSYQAEAVAAITTGLRDGGRARLRAACGTGKTYIASTVAAGLLANGGGSRSASGSSGNTPVPEAITAITHQGRHAMPAPGTTTPASHAAWPPGAALGRRGPFSSLPSRLGGQEDSDATDEPAPPAQPQ
jgi:hypothetical protein